MTARWPYLGRNIGDVPNCYIIYTSWPIGQVSSAAIIHYLALTKATPSSYSPMYVDYPKK